VDDKTWSDIPLFIRDGAIIPMQPVMDYVGEHPMTDLTVDVFPAAKASHFDYYDDDGDTYAYEHGAYFSQRMSTQSVDGGAVFEIEGAKGSFKPALKYYVVRVHGVTAGTVDLGNGALKSYASEQALEASNGEGWTTSHDRYGNVTLLKLAAGEARQLSLHAAEASR
jgi:alpha-glucosidase